MNKLARALTITIALVLVATIVATVAPISTQAQSQGKVESANLSKFAALMKYIRSQPTPSDVHANNVAQLAIFDSVFTDIYITGFITPFTGETP